MLSPTEPVRLVQVGAGLMGRAWLRVIGRSPDVRLVGLADLDRRNCPALRGGRRLHRRRGGHHAGGAAGPGRGGRGGQRDDPGGTRRGQHGGAAARSRRAVREAAGGHAARGPVDDRGRRGQRSAADGLPVPAILAQPRSAARARSPGSASSASSRAASSRPRILAVSGNRWPTRCSRTWRSTSSTWPAT